MEGMQIYAHYQRNVKCPQKGIMMSKPDGTGGLKRIRKSFISDWFNLLGNIVIYCQVVSDLYNLYQWMPSPDIHGE
jgi:hypothetical protein